MLAPGSGIKGMLIAALDPAAESEGYKAALDGLEFLVVQELFLTETAKLAHVVLPAKGVGERDGTFTNLERRVQTFDAGIYGPYQAWADWLIITGLAGQIGADWGYATADGVMAEITQRVPLYAAMDFKNLVAPVSLARKTSHYIYEGMSFTADVHEGVQWASLAERQGEQAAKLPLRFIEPAAPATGTEGEITLVAPRLLYDGGRLLAESEVVESRINKPKALLSRADAGKLGLKTGDMLTLSQNGSSVALPVQINRLVSEGVVIVARNLEGRPAEKLVGPTGLYTKVKLEKS
jgi:predicted molibdopterin-dependent oxidoreductase YjgC